MNWTEVAGFTLALAMVGCNIREIHWGWPLAVVSSLLYFVVFRESKLYGDASLQLFFAVVALWGWFQWLRGHRSDGSALHVARLTPRGRVLTAVVSAALWPAIGWFLKTYTDTDVPWWDAFPTAASIVGQWLLGRKYVENWPVWIVVDIVGAALFVYKGLWLTTLLYLVFVAMAAVGWRSWLDKAAPLRRAIA